MNRIHTMIEQGIVVLKRKKQPLLNNLTSKVYWNGQNIHQLTGGHQDSFFLEAGKGTLTVAAGLLGKKSVQLEVSPRQRRCILISINISTGELILRILSVLIAAAWLLSAILLKTSDVWSSVVVLIGVLLLNISLQINRLQIHIQSNIEHTQNRRAA